jgi:protein involved in polysaccharide export with SLBB domain
MTCSRAVMLVAVIGALGTPVRAADAQTPRVTQPTKDLETRAALEAEARTAEEQHRSGEAFLLRSRLQRGDFQDGDRIVVQLLGTVAYDTTITVRAGKMLPLPRMGDMPLDGVLRSELNDHLSSYLAKFLRDSSARAIPLVRLAVLGQVRSPGYYYTPADVLLSDVLMQAGGPASDADINKMIIRRNGETIWNAGDTRTAVTDGLSLDRLHLRAGDEIFLPEQSHFNWSTLLQVGGVVTSVLVTIITLSR